MNASHAPEPLGMPDLLLGSTDGSTRSDLSGNEAYRKALLQLSASHHPSLDHSPLPSLFAHAPGPTPRPDTLANPLPNTAPMSSHADVPQDNPRLVGRRYHKLADGGVYEELVDVSAHEHNGHGSAVKVRHVTGIPPFDTASHAGHDQTTKIGTPNNVTTFQHLYQSLQSAISPNNSINPICLDAEHDIQLHSETKTAAVNGEREVRRSRSIGSSYNSTPKVHMYGGDGTSRDPLPAFDFQGHKPSSKRHVAVPCPKSSRTASELVAYWEWLDDTTKQADELPSNTTSLKPSRKPDEGHQTKLNELSAAVQVDSPPGTTRPRALTVNSMASLSIDMKFRRAVSDMEHLLNEAMALTKQVAEPGCHPSSETLQLSKIQQRSTQSTKGESEPSLAITRHDEPLVPKALELKAVKQDVGCAHQRRLPKHYRSTPGMRNQDIVDSVSNKTAILERPKLKPGRRLRRKVDLDSHEGSPLEPGCFFNMKKLRKSQSWWNCRSPERQGTDDFHPDDTQPGTQPRLWRAGKPIGDRINRSVISGFDGATDEEPIWPAARHDGPPQATDATSTPDTKQLPPAHLNHPPEPSQDILIHQPPHTLHVKPHVTFQAHPTTLAHHRRHPVVVARDWSVPRKRFVATVACLSTTAIGVLIGIYAGLVPSIQYWIADFEHYAILGNVLLYLGLAIPTFFFWPLPLLHGRKPYILSSLVLAMLLLIPQAVAVSVHRSPEVWTWRWVLLGARGLMGVVLGFASLNFHGVLMDLFGASLVSGNPHQEVVDRHDLRRHGGGMGVWLGLWTWCFTGSLAGGFVVGAAIIDSRNPAWGFYVSGVVVALVLGLNVICPEVRRLPVRGSVGRGRHRGVGGEVMMHRVKEVPTWWGQEVYHGVLLSLEMLRQPGFMVMAVYTGWIYAQIVLVIVLLGSLTSMSYSLRSPLVGLCVAFISIGAFVAIPFQKANLFSRGRHHQGPSSADTLDTRFSWTSHLLRRAIFCIFLPLVGIAYTVASAGPPIPVEVPTLLAALISNLSGLAISECNGLIMEIFDTSDLQLSAMDRLRGNSNQSSRRTNYSSFPRVTAGFAVCHTFGFILAAIATAVGGRAQRNLGQRAATGVVAGFLFMLTLLLLAVLIRFKDVQIIPACKTLEMEKWTELRRESIRRRSEPQSIHHQQQQPIPDPEMWRPILLGNPSCKMRRVNILELGAMSRWTEIRKANRLIDETAAHLNRAALESAAEATGIGAMAAGLVRRVSSRRSNRSPQMRKSPGPFRARSASPMPGGIQLGLLGAGMAVASSHSLPLQRLDPFRVVFAVGDDREERDGVVGQTVVEVEEEDEDEFVSFSSSSDDGDQQVGVARYARKFEGVSRV